MGEKLTSRYERWLSAVASAASIASILAGLVVVAGWTLDIPLLKSFIPGQPPMRPLLAPTFILAGVSLWLLREDTKIPVPRRFWRLFGRLCALGVVVVGLLTLSEYLFGWFRGAGGPLWRVSLPGFNGVRPEDIAPSGSLGLICVGCGLMALDWETHAGYRPTEFLAFGAILEGMFGVLDFILHPKIFTTGISGNSSLLFVVLGTALLSARPEHRFRRLVASRRLGGVAFRRLFPAAVIVPVVLGWLMWRGQQAGLYSSDLGVTLTVVTNVTALVVILLWTAEPLERTDLEHARAREALRKSEASLAEAQRVAHVGNWDWDIVRNELRWSDEIYRIFGLTPQAFGATYEAFLNSVHPNDRELVKQAVNEALSTRTPYGVDHRVVLPDGTVRMVHEQAEAFYDAAGRPLRMLGTVQDITARQQAEEALRRASVYNRNLIETSLDPLVTIAPDGTITDVNRATEKVTGLLRAELIGTDFSNYFSDPEKARAGYQRVFREGWVQDYELEIRHRDGRVTPVVYNASVYQDEGGKVVGVFAAARDISERKQAERELRRLNRALKTLSECNQAIVRAREESELLDGVCRILVEEGGYRLAWVGYAEQDEAKTVRPVSSAGSASGYLDTAKITWAETDRGRGPTGRAIRTGQPSIARDTQEDPDFAPWRKEAARRGFRSSIALPLALDGQTLGALMLYSQTTEAFDAQEVRLLTELAHDLAYGIQALRTRAERQRAEEDLRKLSAMLLHSQDEERRRIARELHDSTGQHLAALAMDLAAVQESAGALAPEAQAILAESLELVSRSSQEIRNFSYLLHPPVLDDFGLASALRWYVKGFAERSGIEVHLELPRELRRLARDAETALFRVVQECLSNIHRHSGSSTARIRIWEEGHQLSLEVEDQGGGIVAEPQEEGEEMMRVGVGVTGMRERMRQLGGQLEIRSHPRGTTVRASVPLLEEAA